MTRYEHIQRQERIRALTPLAATLLLLICGTTYASVSENDLATYLQLKRYDASTIEFLQYTREQVAH